MALSTRLKGLKCDFKGNWELMKIVRVWGVMVEPKSEKNYP